MQVNILEAKNRLSELIKSAQYGDDVVIANRGQPVARLVAIDVRSTRQREKNFLQWLERNPLPAHAQHSAREIDTAILSERSAWD